MAGTVLTCGRDYMACGRDYMACGRDYMACGRDCLGMWQGLSWHVAGTVFGMW